MTDVGSHRFVKASAKSDGDVLVPQPSDDPHDPLVCVRSTLHHVLMVYLTCGVYAELESTLEVQHHCPRHRRVVYPGFRAPRSRAHVS